MKSFARLRGPAIVLSCLMAYPFLASAQTPRLLESMSQELFLHDSQGYLGVDLREIDGDRARELNLKKAGGAEIINVDHDAPAGKAGLKVHDVILQMNGRSIQDVEQLRHILHATAPGRTVTLLISRNGDPLAFTLQLADRALLQQQAWAQHFIVPEPAPRAASDEAPVASLPSGSSSFLGTSISRELYTGADLNPVRPQLGDYFGVKSGVGLLVESVDDESPAARAGLKAGDVILKVDSDPMVSRNDWLTAIQNHRGMRVQLAIMRDRQPQTLTMTAGESK